MVDWQWWGLKRARAENRDKELATTAQRAIGLRGKGRLSNGAKVANNGCL